MTFGDLEVTYIYICLDLKSYLYLILKFCFLQFKILSILKLRERDQLSVFKDLKEKDF